MIAAISLGGGGAGLYLVPTWTTCATGAVIGSLAMIVRSVSTPFTTRTRNVTRDSPLAPDAVTYRQPTYWSGSSIVSIGAAIGMVSTTVDSLTRSIPTIAPGTIGPSAATASRSCGPRAIPAAARKLATVPGWARNATGVPPSTTVTGNPRSRTIRRPATSGLSGAT